jgi:hypothetical protein
METLTVTKNQELTQVKLRLAKNLSKLETMYKKSQNGDFDVVTNVFGTTNYNKLEFYKANRSLKRHFKNIIKSMEVNGNLSVGLVAKVNGVYYIIDGQHRFSACKELNIPFEFKVVELDSTDDMVRMISSLNSSSAKWKDLDYLEAWAEEGKSSFKWLKEVNDEFKSITFSNLKNVFGWKPAEFKMGTWSISKTEFFKGVRLLRQINDITPILFADKKISSQPMRAVIDAIKHPNYNHTKMLKVINDGKGTWDKDETILRSQLLGEVTNF